jgi:hypothetical protein
MARMYSFWQSFYLCVEVKRALKMFKTYRNTAQRKSRVYSSRGTLRPEVPKFKACAPLYSTGSLLTSRDK